MRAYLVSPHATLTVELSDSVMVLDDHTIEVDVPPPLRDQPDVPERMPFAAWQVLDLHQGGDADGLAALGVTVLERADRPPAN